MVKNFARTKDDHWDYLPKGLDSVKMKAFETGDYKKLSDAKLNEMHRIIGPKLQSSELFNGQDRCNPRFSADSVKKMSHNLRRVQGKSEKVATVVVHENLKKLFQTAVPGKPQPSDKPEHKNIEVHYQSYWNKARIGGHIYIVRMLVELHQENGALLWYVECRKQKKPR